MLRKIIPAIRLPDGRILSGGSHSSLLLEAIGLGVENGMDSGYLNDDGAFKPTYPKPSDFLPKKIKGKRHAIAMADRASWAMRDAAVSLIRSGRDDDEFLKIFVDRMNSLCHLPMMPAIRNTDSGEVFSGALLHTRIKPMYPNLVPASTLDRYSGPVSPAELGWVHFDGRFLTKAQAAYIATSLTGVTIDPHRFVAGEEWIPRLDSEEDAIYLGMHFHFRGRHSAKQRIKIFDSIKKYRKHCKLLKIALDVFQQSE